MKTLDDKTRNLLLAIKKLLDSIKDESENDSSSRDKIAEEWQKLTQLLSLIYNLIPIEIRDQLVREFFQGLITNISNADLDQILLNLKTRKSLFENVPNGQHYLDIIDNFDNFLNIRSQQPQQPKQKKSIPFFSKIKQILPSLFRVPKTKVVNLFKSSVSAIKRGTNLILFSKDKTGEKEQKIQTGKDINPIDRASVTTVTKADAGTSITTGASAEIKGNPETGIGNTKIITPNSNLSLKERQESLLNSEGQKRKEVEEQERKRKLEQKHSENKNELSEQQINDNEKISELAVKQVKEEEIEKQKQQKLKEEKLDDEAKKLRQEKQEENNLKKNSEKRVIKQHSTSDRSATIADNTETSNIAKQPEVVEDSQQNETIFLDSVEGDFNANKTEKDILRNDIGEIIALATKEVDSSQVKKDDNGPVL
ncbi:MAG: hypothetical protein LBS34_00375 [Rickettsiales bacterium]|jgi:hypothetical protein|nr:hypothetical protein [Rickettsiales bacterium]